MPTAELLRGAVAVSPDRSVHLRIEPDVSDSLDAWRAEHHWWSRTAAINALLRWALAQNPALRQGGAE